MIRALRPLAVAALLCFFSACATSGSSKRTASGKEQTQEESSGWDIGMCRPLFPSTSGGLSNFTYDEPWHSCWHRFWEVPAALVVYPVIVGAVVGVVASPIWVPILLH